MIINNPLIAGNLPTKTLANAYGQQMLNLLVLYVMVPFIILFSLWRLTHKILSCIHDHNDCTDIEICKLDLCSRYIYKIKTWLCMRVYSNIRYSQFIEKCMLGTKYYMWAHQLSFNTSYNAAVHFVFAHCKWLDYAWIQWPDDDWVYAWKVINIITDFYLQLFFHTRL